MCNLFGDVGLEHDLDEPTTAETGGTSSRPPWSPATQPKPTGRCRLYLRSPENLSKSWGVAQSDLC